MAERNVNVSVKINELTESNAHELRELTLEGMKAEEAKKFLDGVTNDMAPHYHRIVVGYEKFVREAPELQEVHGSDPALIAEETLKVLEGKMEQEISFLTKEHDWDGKNLPDACYKALRSIINCLKYGGSLLEHQTVSQCKKFAAQRKKEIREAAAKAHDAAQAPANDGEVTPADLQDDPRLTKEQAEKVQELATKLAEAYKLNPEFADSLVEATTSKARSIVQKALAKLAEKTAKVA